MSDYVLLAALLCGILSASTGNRTAWLLLGSLAFSMFLGSIGVPFNFYFWMMIDLAVILGIIRRGMTHADVAILALFAPAWLAYLAGGDVLIWGTWGVVVAQLLLTFPASFLRRHARCVIDHIRKGRADMMVMA